MSDSMKDEGVRPTDEVGSYKDLSITEDTLVSMNKDQGFVGSRLTLKRNASVRIRSKPTETVELPPNCSFVRKTLSSGSVVSALGLRKGKRGLIFVGVMNDGVVEFPLKDAETDIQDFDAYMRAWIKDNTSSSDAKENTVEVSESVLEEIDGFGDW